MLAIYIILGFDETIFQLNESICLTSNVFVIYLSIVTRSLFLAQGLTFLKTTIFELVV